MSSIKMITASVHFTKDGKETVANVEDAFVASEEPYYIGIGLRPSPGLWEFLKSGKNSAIELDGKILEYRVEFSIDVGENTLFFLSPFSD